MTRLLERPTSNNRTLLVALALLLAASACSSGAGPVDAGSDDVGGADYVFDGGGNGTAATPTHAFVANRNDGAISVFVVDPQSGELTYHGYDVVPDAFSVENLMTHPSGEFLLAVSGSAIHSFEIDARAGRLVPFDELPGSGANARGMAINLDGGVVYAADRSADSIASYGIDDVSGELSAIDPVATGQNPVDIVLHPGGALLYSVDRDDRQISAYPVDDAGALGPRRTAYTDESFNLTALAFAPGGDFAYATLSEDDQNVRQLAVNVETGLLAQTGTTTVGQGPLDIVVDPTGAFAYTANARDNSITVLGIANGTGELTSVQTIRTSNEPANLSFDPSGDFLYAGFIDSTDISVFAVDSGGLLEPVDRVRARNLVGAIAFRQGNGSVQLEAEHLYVPNPEDGQVHLFDIDSGSGALGTIGIAPVGERPTNLAVHPSGAYAYVVNGNSSDVYAFDVDPETGELSQKGTYTIGGFDNMLLTRLAVDPSGRFVYVLDNRDGLDSPGRIFLFDINPDGRLTYDNEVNGTSGINSGGDNPENLIIHPSGRYMYVMNSYGDNVTLFEIAERNGFLTQRQMLPSLDRPLHAAIHPNGRWIYITVQNEMALHKYTIRDDNGSLISLQTLEQASDPPAQTSHVAVHPSGDYVYLSGRDGTVSWYAVDRNNGNLTFVDLIAVTNGPEWLSVTPDGRHAYGVSSNGVQRFSIDAATGAISYIGEIGLEGLGTYQRSLTVGSVRR